jgi:hypothetical protein
LEKVEESCQSAPVDFPCFRSEKASGDFPFAILDLFPQVFIEGLPKLADDLSPVNQSHGACFFEHICVIQNLRLDRLGQFGFPFMAADAMADSMASWLVKTEAPEDL